MKNIETLRSTMSEPLSATAGAVGAKLISASGIGTIVAAVTVMALTLPKTKREFFVALLVTVFLSIYGGSALIAYLGLYAWSDEARALFHFIAGVPGWVLVRGFFAYTERDKSKGLLEYFQDWLSIRKAWNSEE